MADNYLERRMDEHRRTQGASVRTVYRGPAAGTITIAGEGADAVFVSGFESAPALASAIVRAMRKAAYRVAFAWADLNRGRALAQGSGSRHYPVEPDAHAGARQSVAELWGGLDVAITAKTETSLSLTSHGRTFAIEGAEDCPAASFADAASRLCPCLALVPVACIAPGRIKISAEGIPSADI